MRKLVVLFVCFILAVSCDSESALESDSQATGPDSTFEFSFRNKEEADLLNPNTDGYYSHEQVRVYLDPERSQDITTQFTGDWDFVIPPETSGSQWYWVYLDASLNGNVGDVSYYLQLSAIDVDTIVAKTRERNAWPEIYYLEYNGVILFDDLESKRLWDGVIYK
ncbi:hypothetical protein [Reichenbachiella sp. MSK19-1]|uniref:hypothetical protein n=1 Tax=Reichenbachiella sp. MSK19-1 TaxID=1897631 RepID=UPI000E6B9270|nr:hypothetical protein [Reichenbachiella sp. MSK19-1]RJE73035.1 hypothetical protein BGP76_03570 [Reichenbachiella sp. MSK19-1]